LEENIEKLKNDTDESKYDEYYQNIVEYSNQINVFLDKSYDYNEQESLFCIELSEFDLKNITKKFDIYKQLWKTTKDWKTNKNKWLTCKFNDLDGIKVDREVSIYKSNLLRCKKSFKEELLNEKLYNLVEKLLNEIIDFEKYVPLAVNLRVEGMEERHWDALSEKTGIFIEY